MTGQNLKERTFLEINNNLFLLLCLDSRDACIIYSSSHKMTLMDSYAPTPHYGWLRVYIGLVIKADGPMFVL